MDKTVFKEQKSNRWRRVTAITGAGLLAGLIAVGIGGAASAQTVITERVEPAAVGMGLVQVDDDAEDLETETDHEISGEDEAVFERFELCLQDAGFDFDSEVEPDKATAEAAFEQCDPILDALSADFDHDFVELSAEDEAVFDRFDQCLQDAGLDFDAETEPSDDVYDAAFEQCDPILDDLSEDAQMDFVGDFDGELSPEDEAVFDRFDQCLQDAGLDVETEADVDDATVDAAIEGCEPILEELSEDAGAFLDCPDDE